ncbi:AAA family ATPase [Pelagibacterium sp. H642]|uniref:AAA family ATPase n=1 Tax=Pelagibacterium sp. H642 TaxID=1881069 RepID=UPI0028163739|nr:AAA family ATPase [Pelagibacterium sp. H642]WMT92718.1 ATP-binding protein [Pelagibacterium sp. H642]
MRIAVTGTHGIGKTTFIDDFAAAYPGYESVAEPYWLLDQQGLPFSGGATIGDLEKQLSESCKLIMGSAGGRDVVFDRCPLDFLAYLEVVSASEGFEWLPSGRELAQISKALAKLDVVIFVPLSSPDEILVKIEHPRLRSRVDRRLKTMLRDDDLGLLHDGPRIVEVVGSRAQRVAIAGSVLGLA